MDLALCHSNMDFDCLSAQYALTRLYPGCKMVLSNQLTGNVRNFIALNRNLLPTVDIKYVDMTRVDRIFLVDCQHIERLDEAVRAALTSVLPGRAKGRMPASASAFPPIIIFDHHAPGATEGSGAGRGGAMPAPGAAGSQIEYVGASTTLLVEKIMTEAVPLTSFDATVLAIGIYEDTGCLTFAGTTSRDAACVAFLLSRGADLALVREYMRTRLEADQIELFETLLQQSMTLEVEGHRYLIAAHSTPDFVDGLAVITRQLLELQSCEGAFTIVHMRDRVHLVGRSDSRTLDVRQVVRAFGGDGHPGAGSAVIKGGDVHSIKAEVVELIRQMSVPQPVAKDIMVSPIRTIRPDISMDEAGRLMLRYAMDGLVVMDNDEPVGIISRRDIDQSRHHRLGHARVSGFMSRPVLTVPEDATLVEMQQLMVSEDIGRLPVLDGQKRLVGLVSRQDVLNSLYGQAGGGALVHRGSDRKSRRSGLAASGNNLSQRLQSFSAPIVEIIKVIGTAAQSADMTAYAVGGFVRDMLLERANFDLDFVIEGAAIELAETLARSDARFEIMARHERFGTANLLFKDGGIEQEVDLSTARTEFYEFPAALPEVEPSKLEQDLLRRDFTVNALAVCINPSRFGELVDHFNGVRDLERKVIRILHPFSFIEDPTRIVRAARFAGRLGFHLDPTTKEQAKRAVSMGIFDDLGGVRIKEELKLILQSAERIKCLSLLQELGGNLCYLDRQLSFSGGVKRSLRRAERLLARYGNLGLEQAYNGSEAQERFENWIVYLGVLLSELVPERVESVLLRLQLTNKQRDAILSGLDLHRQMPLSMGELSRSELYLVLKGRPLQSLAIAASIAQVGTDLRRALKLYFDELVDTSLEITGRDLLSLGFAAGPRLGQVLEQVLAARLDKKIAGKEEELKLAGELLMTDH